MTSARRPPRGAPARRGRTRSTGRAAGRGGHRTARPGGRRRRVRTGRPPGVGGGSWNRPTARGWRGEVGTGRLPGAGDGEFEPADRRGPSGADEVTDRRTRTASGPRRLQRERAGARRLVPSASGTDERHGGSRHRAPVRERYGVPVWSGLGVGAECAAVSSSGRRSVPVSGDGGAAFWPCVLQCGSGTASRPGRGWPSERSAPQCPRPVGVPFRSAGTAARRLGPACSSAGAVRRPRLAGVRRHERAAPGCPSPGGLPRRSAVRRLGPAGLPCRSGAARRHSLFGATASSRRVAAVSRAVSLPPSSSPPRPGTPVRGSRASTAASTA